MKLCRTILSRTCGLIVSTAILALGTSGQAAVTVFMDYSGFTARLNELTNSAGVAGFTAGEQDTIKAGILSSLQMSFDVFDVSFSETAPAEPHPRLWFGGIGSSFGVADHIDYRNKQAGDLARVFTAEFDSFVEVGEPRAQQINELTMSLAGTSAHELGHNFGLRHHDSYGDASIVFTGTPINTGGVQNTHIMATGSTGLSEEERETPRTFSEHSLVKLSFAEGLTSSVPATIVEGADFGDDTGAATPLTFINLAAVDRSAVNIAGQIGNNSDADVFSFTLAAGSRLSADVNIDFPNSIPFENVDTFIELIDSNGTTVLASDDSTTFNDDSFGVGSGEFDPWLINVPIANSGTYFLRLSPEVPDSGDYELLIHTDLQVSLDGDFNDDGSYDCADIDALVADIAGPGMPETFDLTGDGIVDLDDRDAWLAEAAAANGLGSPYLLGDADLSGTVDFIDLNRWAENRFTATAAFCAGDWDASGLVDFIDLNLWSVNRFQSSDATVPEPTTSLSLLILGCIAITALRRSGISK